jgi:hypothetical protein
MQPSLDARHKSKKPPSYCARGVRRPLYDETLNVEAKCATCHYQSSPMRLFQLQCGFIRRTRIREMKRYDNSLPSNEIRSSIDFDFRTTANFNPTQTTLRGWRKKSKAESCYPYESTNQPYFAAAKPWRCLPS